MITCTALIQNKKNLWENNLLYKEEFLTKWNLFSDFKTFLIPASRSDSDRCEVESTIIVQFAYTEREREIWNNGERERDEIMVSVFFR